VHDRPCICPGSNTVSQSAAGTKLTSQVPAVLNGSGAAGFCTEKLAFRLVYSHSHCGNGPAVCTAYVVLRMMDGWHGVTAPNAFG